MKKNIITNSSYGFYIFHKNNIKIFLKYFIKKYSKYSKDNS